MKKGDIVRCIRYYSLPSTHQRSEQFITNKNYEITDCGYIWGTNPILDLCLIDGIYFHMNREQIPYGSIVSPYFYDYFSTIKEDRKLKIEKLNKITAV